MTENTGPVFTRTVTQERIAAYAEASGDHNPVHLDADFAATTRFGGTIAHGMILFGYMSEALSQVYGAAWAGTGRMRARFRAPARPGDVVEVSAEERSRQPRDDGTIDVHCIVECWKAEPRERLATGDATLTVKEQ
ncbi:MAG: MaoC family dehydratase [Dehalococcoidia bacterium]|nr:MaoC family dehydratase [Dehalococcoidia bacterium]